AVDAAELLLLAQLDRVLRELGPCLAVLPRRIVAALDRALVGIAALTFQEELQPFPPAQATNGSCVSCHACSSDPATLGWPATVVGDRRHVLDDAHVEPRRLQAAQRRLASRARTLHVHLDVTHAELGRLPSRRLGRDLRGEGRALARPFEAALSGA